MVVATWPRRKWPPGGPLGTTLRAYSEGITGQAEDPPTFPRCAVDIPLTCLGLTHRSRSHHD